MLGILLLEKNKFKASAGHTAVGKKHTSHTCTCIDTSLFGVINTTSANSDHPFNSASSVFIIEFSAMSFLPVPQLDRTFTSKVGHHEIGEMERTKSIANGTKRNVAGCPKLKPTKPILRIGQWQYIGSHFPSNDPLHLFGQRHGMSCASLSSRPYIGMGLVETNKYKTTPLCQIRNLPCNVCIMDPLLHTRTHFR